MGLYRHPHLVRGTVHTPKGAFVILRGIVDVPDEIGEQFGWEPIGDDEPIIVRAPLDRAAPSPIVRQ